jgi:ankyrin repeat protein
MSFHKADIFVCAQTGDLNQLRVLVENQGVSVNLKEADGNTPLHWACFQNHLPVVQYLVEKG